MTQKKVKEFWETMSFKATVILGIISLGIVIYTTFFKKEKDTANNIVKTVSDSSKNQHIVEGGKNNTILSTTIDQVGNDSVNKIVKFGDSSKFKDVKIKQ